jgi:hypothetical protein
MEGRMTREDQGHYAKKHPSDKTVNKEVAEALKKRTVNGQLACAVAFDIAADLGASPGEVGYTLDMLEIRLIKCQLGLFGYGPGKKSVQPLENLPESLEKAIRSGLSDGTLPCATAWKVAEKLGVGKRDVSAACDTLGVKIRPCQLGAF